MTNNVKFNAKNIIDNRGEKTKAYYNYDAEAGEIYIYTDSYGLLDLDGTGARQKNDSDSMTDYFEHTVIYICPEAPAWFAAAAAFNSQKESDYKARYKKGYKDNTLQLLDSLECCLMSEAAAEKIAATLRAEVDGKKEKIKKAVKLDNISIWAVYHRYYNECMKFEYKNIVYTYYAASNTIAKAWGKHGETVRGNERAALIEKCKEIYAAIIDKADKLPEGAEFTENAFVDMGTLSYQFGTRDPEYKLTLAADYTVKAPAVPEVDGVVTAVAAAEAEAKEMLKAAEEVLPPEVMEMLHEISKPIFEEAEEIQRAKIEMTSNPDNDPEPPKPTRKNTAYSAFDEAFRASEIISVTFGGVSDSSADTEHAASRLAPVKRKKLTEKEWKKQLEAKAAFEAEQAEQELQKIRERLIVGTKLFDDVDGEYTITKIEPDDEDNDPEWYHVEFDNGSGEYLKYIIGEIQDGTIKIIEPAETSEPDPDQITFENVTYSANDDCPINEDLARRALESYSFSDYVPGSASAEWRRSMREVRELAEKAKRKAPQEFHGDIDRLVSKYAAKLAAWTNDYHRIQASCPSWFVTGPANYPTRKHERQMQAFGRSFEELEKIEHIKDRIKCYAHRAIMCGDESALDRLTEKVAWLTEYHERMKRENAESRKNGGETPHPAWELSNNLKNLREAEARLDRLKKAKAAPTAEADDLKNDYCKVVRNSDIMRLQLIFDGKPDDKTRETLKRNGFKWAPSQKAWQRQLTPNAERAAKAVITALS